MEALRACVIEIGDEFFSGDGTDDEKYFLGKWVDKITCENFLYSLTFVWEKV